MLTHERLARIGSRLATIAGAADAALDDATALRASTAEQAPEPRLAELDDALRRLQLECTDAQHALHQVQAGAPGSDILQLRLV